MNKRLADVNKELAVIFKGVKQATAATETSSSCISVYVKPYLLPLKRITVVAEVETKPIL